MAARTGRSATPGARRSPASGSAASPASAWGDRLEAACHARGLPVTVQRRVVLEALGGRRDHPTADLLFEDVAARLPGVSRATVYRTLDALEDFGLAVRLPSPSGSARFEARRPRHDHAHCLRCGRVEDVAPAPERRTPGAPPSAPRGFAVHDWSVHLLGLCARCRAGQYRPSARPAARGSSRRASAAADRRRPAT